MSLAVIYLCTFACIFGGTLLGLFLRTMLPHDRLDEESKASTNRSNYFLSLDVNRFHAAW